MTISVRLPESVEKRLSNLAKETGRTKTFYITQAICDSLDDLEDLYLAEQSLIRVKSGQEKTYSIEEVEAALGLAD